MVDAAPLHALRYDPAVVGSLAATSAPAYDLIDPIAYAHHRTANPYTVLELLAPDDAYERSAQLFRQWRRSGVLVPEEPAFFRYEEHEIGGGSVGSVGSERPAPAGTGVPMLHIQRGLLAAVRLEPTDGGVILAHEEVDDERVSARLRRLEAVPAELDPVYLVLDDPPPEVTRILTSEPATPPVVATTDEQGTDHRIWPLRDAALQQELRRALAGCRAMIADGHHRYARSLAYRERRRAVDGGRAHDWSRAAPWEGVFAYLVDPRAGGPRIEAIHRLIAPLSDAQVAVLLEDFTTSEAPPEPGVMLRHLDDVAGIAFGLILPGGRGRILRAREAANLEARIPAEHREIWKRLDAAVLLHAVLPRLALRPGSVRARADADEAASEVARSHDAALLLLRPPSLGDVLRLASEGQRLPYKSTRFVPKPRTGLLMRPLEDASARTSIP